MLPPAASFTFAIISSIFAGLSKRHVKSTTDTSGVGTRNAMPVNFPFNAGKHLPTAFAAPVAEGMMFADAQRPPRQSLPPRLGPSTVSCVAVVAWTVVIRPSVMPKLLWITFARGARQLVVHEALETTVSAPVYFVLFTPMTYIGTESF